MFSYTTGVLFIHLQNIVNGLFIPHAGLEMFRKSLDFGQAGDQLGALVRGIKRDEVRRGMVMCAPGTVTGHTKIQAQVYVLKKEEGGRHKPFVTGFQPQLFTRTADMTVTMALPEGNYLLMFS